MSAIAAIWLRNFLYFRKTFIVIVFWTVFEPVLYLFAFGLSIGKLIGALDGVDYIQFYVPALLTTTAMTISYLESTYSTFTKLKHQKTYFTIYLTPVKVKEIVLAEVLWFTSKGAFGFLSVALVASIFGAFRPDNLIMTFLTLILTSFMFASIGVLVASFAKNYESFTYSVSGFMVPMSLFSGTLFPLNQMPEWLQSLAYFLPLIHSVKLVRGFVLGQDPEYVTLHFLYILIVTIISLLWGFRRMSDRIET